jgi:hypothetical protein
MSIEYQNDGNKEIAAVKFKVLFVDAVGDAHNSFQKGEIKMEKRLLPELPQDGSDRREGSICGRLCLAS